MTVILAVLKQGQTGIATADLDLEKGKMVWPQLEFDAMFSHLHWKRVDVYIEKARFYTHTQKNKLKKKKLDLGNT